MNFDISALSEDFKSGLAELKKDYNFSINGKTAVFTEFGHTAGIVRTGDGFLISFAEVTSNKFCFSFIIERS